MRLFYIRLVIFFAFFLLSIADLYEGDECKIRDQPGLCTVQDRCPELEFDFYKGFIRNEEIPRCGYVIDKEVICCPLVYLNNSVSQTINYQLPRAAERACRIIEVFSEPTPEKPVLGGNRVAAEEYPHMVAIGYKSFENENRKYEYGCAGSLLSDKFVLTAAHCLLDPRRQPDVVLLGTVDLNDEENGVLINVKAHYLHSESSSSNIYNDIGLIEMEKSAPFGPNIYPICLNTNTDDLPLDANVNVLEWGKIGRGGSSNKLLKAEVNLVPLDKCNEKFSAFKNRKTKLGIQNTQICAEYTERDACNGNSGGPLLWIRNGTFSQSRLIGIISAGIKCDGEMPGIYTRVSSYLNFIEAIVWPNSKFD